MLERALPGIGHGNLGGCLVAGNDRLEIPLRATGLKDGAHPLPDADIGPVPEGEEGIGNHYRMRQPGPVARGEAVDMLLFLIRPFVLRNGQLKVGIAHAVAIEAEDVGILDIGLMDGDFRHPDAVLFPRADADGTTIFNVNN